MLLSNTNKTIVKVLIDTWWNVNDAKTDSTEYGGGVLIDTWWNVNPEKLQICTVRLLF